MAPGIHLFRNYCVPQSQSCSTVRSVRSLPGKLGLASPPRSLRVGVSGDRGRRRRAWISAGRMGEGRGRRETGSCGSRMGEPAFQVLREGKGAAGFWAGNTSRHVRAHTGGSGRRRSAAGGMLITRGRVGPGGSGILARAASAMGELVLVPRGLVLERD